MSVITISREIGSQGREIAKAAAQELGYHFMDKGTIGMVLGEYGLVEFGREYEVAPTFWDRFDARRMERREEMVSMLNRVILALARHGNMVILGRCGFAVLENFSNVLNVRVQAPIEVRTARVMNAHSFGSLAQAQDFVKDNDEVRTSFIESFYGVKWDCATAFNLVIDTGKVDQDQAAEWVAAAARWMEEHPPQTGQATSSIAVDATLDNVIGEVLHCSKAH